MGKLTLGSLFSGSGGFELAGTLAGIEPVWNSEIAPFPIRVTSKRFPNVKHYGDINNISGAEIEPVDIITFGSPCFPAGTLVLTDKGYVEIENVKIGMRVLTHKGRWRKVTAVGSKIGETIVLKGNHYGLECTPNHPIYSAEIKHSYPKLQNGKRTEIRLISEEKNWTPAEDMQAKLWAVPNKIDKVPMALPHYTGNYREKPFPTMDEDFFYFVGRWLGDGWVYDGQRSGRPKGQRAGNIILCDSLDKEEELRCIVEKVTDRYCIERCETVVKFKFISKVFCEWLTENFGKYASGKKIPSWVYGMDEEYRVSLLNGVLDSDGYMLAENKYKVCTISKKLAHGLRLLAETLGYSTTVYKHEPAHTKVIEGRLVNQKPCFTLQLTKSKTVKRLSDEEHSWYRVRNIQSTHETKCVYNLTVDEDNSYIADDIVVHNCQDLSLAGRRIGLQGERSGLFMQAIRVVKEMRCATNGKYPRWILWENVPGALSSSKGQDFRTVLDEICKVKDEALSVPMPESKWTGAGEILGDDFSAAWRTLDAQYWGVPQRRRRVFLVADFGGQTAGKILFESESVCGHFNESGAARKSSAGNAQESSGAASGIILNDQGGSRMNVTSDVTSTLRAETHGHTPCVMSSAGFCTEHSAKSRSIGYEEENAPTLRAGVVPAAVTLNERQMGLTVSEELANTLSETDYKGTQCVFENHSQDTRYTGPLDTAPTLSAKYGTGGNNQPFVVKNYDVRITSEGTKNARQNVYETETSRALDTSTPTPDRNQGGVAVVESYSIQGSMIGRADKNGPQGSGINKDVSFTLNTADKHAVYAFDRAAYNQGKNAQFDISITDDDTAQTVVAKGPGAVAAEPQYTVRRLTPLECCRLQGFPGKWCDGLETLDPTEDEIREWSEIFETYRKATGKSTKPKSRNQIIKWLRNPYSDSAMYSMWGNGIALPCGYYVLNGIANLTGQV